MFQYGFDPIESTPFFTPNQSPQPKTLKNMFSLHHYHLSSSQSNQQGNKEDILIKFIPGKHVKGLKSLDLLRINKNYRVQVTPFNKRKKTERESRIGSISQIMQFLSPKQEHTTRKKEETLYERIEKLREINRINYKFKKSLAEVKKRKKQRQKFASNRSHLIREEAKAHLHAKIGKNTKNALKQKCFTDIYDAGDDVEDLFRKNSQKKWEKDIVIEQKDVKHYLRASSEENKDNFCLRHKELLNRMAQAYRFEVKPFV